MKKHAKTVHKITFIPFFVKDSLFTIASPLIKKRNVKSAWNALQAIVKAIANFVYEYEFKKKGKR
jgi:hypothetical protein